MIVPDASNKNQMRDLERGFEATEWMRSLIQRYRTEKEQFVKNVASQKEGSLNKVLTSSQK